MDRGCQAKSGKGWREMAVLREKLGPKKEAAILALLTARSIEDAARNAQIPARTLYRWLQEPEFDAVYRKARRAAFAQATDDGMH